MKNLILLIFLLIFSSIPLKAQKDQAKNIVSGELGEKLDAEMQQLAEKGFSGVFFVAKNGQIALGKGYGLADKESKTSYSYETVFDIGSITKQFTGAAILKLEMQGKIKTSDKISKYFKDVPADKTDITIHHLLTHSSGLIDVLGGDYEKLSREEMIKGAFASKLLSKPGEKYEYSNLGYSLLGAVIEIVSEKSYEKYLNENLFLPAGMNKTGYVIPNWKRENLAVGYKKDGSRWGTPIDQIWDKDGPFWSLRANGGILSTAQDLYKWHLALEDEKILSKEAKKKYYAPHIAEQPEAVSFYGYGWVIQKTGSGKQVIWHNGGNPYFFADFRRYVDDNVVVIVATNAPIQPLAKDFARIVSFAVAYKDQQTSDSDTPPDKRQSILPTADHHTHIWSLNASKFVTPSLQPIVQLPDDLTSLLQKREKGWNDKSALAEIYTQDSFIIESERTWIRGREAVSARAAEIFARAYRIQPTAYEINDSHGYLTGYIVRDIENGLRHFGHIHLSLKKNSSGAWQIAAESLNFPGPQVAEEASAEKLIAQLDAVGVKRAAVLSVAFWFGSVFRKVDDEYAKVKAENDWVAEQVAKYPNRLVGFCSFNPLKDYALKEFERCAKNPRFKGLKLHFGNSGVDVLNAEHTEKLRAVFSAANKRRFPILVHLWTRDKIYGAKHSEVFLNKIVSAAPDIPIQIAHLAASGPGYHSDDALEVFANAAAANNPLMKNLYFDAASIVTNTLPQEALELVAKRLRQIGLHRVLFASDFAPGGPNAAPKDAWEAFRRLPLTEKEFEIIAGNVAPYMR